MIIPAPLIYAGGAAVAALLQFYFPVSVVSDGRGVWWGIVALSVASLLLMLWALVVMLLAKTSPNPYQASRQLVFRGPYQYSRNPMYLGMNGLYLACALFVNSLWFFLLFWPVLVLLKRYVILHEEAYLASRFGLQYQDYKKRVRRWL